MSSPELSFPFSFGGLVGSRGGGGPCTFYVDLSKGFFAFVGDVGLIGLGGDGGAPSLNWPSAQKSFMSRLSSSVEAFDIFLKFWSSILILMLRRSTAFCWCTMNWVRTSLGVVGGGSLTQPGSWSVAPVGGPVAFTAKSRPSKWLVPTMARPILTADACCFSTRDFVVSSIVFELRTPRSAPRATCCGASSSKPCSSRPSTLLKSLR